MKKILNALVLSSVLGFSFAAYAEMDMSKMDMKESETKTMSLDKVIAVAKIIDTSGKKIGVASFIPTDSGVKISVQVTSLIPGKHGIHIHQVGKCDTPNFKSAGGHFNPYKHEHGLNNAKGAHNGDMANIEIDSSGNGSVIIENKMVRLGNANPLLRIDGASIIIHAKADDQKSQPAGNAGDRIGCGVIEVLK